MCSDLVAFLILQVCISKVQCLSKRHILTETEAMGLMQKSEFVACVRHEI